jgi:DNA polymerase-1
MTSSKCLILVDGSSFLYRAYHALPPLISPQGLATNAMYGVANMLRKMLADYSDAYFAVIFDAPGKTFRHDLYDQYKAHRPPMPDDLRCQIEPLHRLVRAMGLPLIIESGIEADDVMGCLAKKAEGEGFEVIISTGDKDMAQLVSEHIILENTMNSSRLDIQGVIEKFGVRPDQIIDYLALIGDPVDNIPGVPKVGPKTAAKWLEQYETLENLIANAEQISGKIGENLRASLEQLPLSKQLTTVKWDIELPYRIEDLERKPTDPAELRALLTEFGFTTWLKALDKEATAQSASVSDAPSGKSNYETVLTEDHFERWLARLNEADLVAFDTETTSLDYGKARIVGVSFAVEAGQAAYVPLAHDYVGAPEQINKTHALERLRPLLENPGKAKLGQNIKYDLHVLANEGIDLQGIAHDTMLESYIYNSTATKHNMDDLAKKYLGVETIHYEDIAG